MKQFAPTLVFILLGLCAAAAVLTGVANIAFLVQCGATPTGEHPFSGFGFLLSANTEAFGLAPTGCVPDAGGIYMTYLIAALMIGAVIFGLSMGWLRVRDSDWYFRLQLLFRDGFARAGEIRKNVSARSLLRRARQLRPALKKPTPDQLGVRLGRARGMDVMVSVEDSMVLSAAPRGGKGFRFVISSILDWDGPLITTSTRNDNLSATYEARKRMGEVTVVDPQGLSGLKSRKRPALHTGCEDPLIAEMRGRAMIAGSALGQSATNQEWAGISAGLLAALLQAAALSGEGTAALRRWTQNPALCDPAIAILRDQGAPGWSQMLESTVKGDPELLANSWIGVREAGKPLLIPGIYDALSPEGDAVLDPREFLEGRNTLYLIGTGSGAGATGGYLAAILDDIVEQARRKALASQGGRLDPPLGLILDELANMFVWPALPTVLSDGGGIGIFTQVVFQSMSQAATVWSESEAQTIWNSAIVKVLLGGSTDVRHMQDISNMLGERKVLHRGRSWSEDSTTHSEQRATAPVLSVDELRRLPTGMAVLAYKNIRPVLLDAKGWTKRSDASQIHADRRSTELEQLSEFQRQYARRTTDV